MGKKFIKLLTLVQLLLIQKALSLQINNLQISQYKINKLLLLNFMDPEGLFKVQDVNAIIKVFAFSIQERFQQIDGIRKNHSDSHSRYLSYESIQDSDHIIRKYKNYFSTQQNQVKYLQKLAVRILQILQFFKQRSKNQQFLVIAIKKVEEKLNRIVKNLPIDVQWLYSTILDLAKNGFSIKRTPKRDRRNSLRKIDVSDHKVSQTPTEPKKQITNEQPSQEIRLVQTSNRQRRAVSLSAKRPPKPPIQKQSIQQQINRLYSILDIETNYVQKIIQNKDKNKLEKESLKQNTIILSLILNYDKNYSCYIKKKEKDPTLREVNNRSMRPIINNWISRKRKIAECRKRLVESENVSII